MTVPSSGDGEDAERVMAVLAERAAKLALPEEEPRETVLADILIFRLAHRKYALEMKYIREVFIIREITPVPGTPEYIAGICAVRGEIVSLVDLRILFAIPQKGLTDLNRVIVLTDGRLTFGILADYITDIGTVPTDDLAPAEPGENPIGERFILGVADGQLTILNAAAILADPRMVIDDSRQ